MQVYRDKPNTAILKMTDAIIMCPSSAIMLCSRARILYDLGEVSAAIRDLEVAKERNNQHAPSRLLLAKCYNLVCEYEKALTECRIAQALDYTDEGRELQRSLEQRLEDMRVEEERQKAKAKDSEKERPVEDVTADGSSPSPAAPEGANKAPASFKDQLYAEIGELKQKHGEAALPPAFRVLDTLESEARNLSAGRAQKLMQNEKVMKAFADPEFQRKLDEMGKDPAKAAEYMKDKDFREGFQAVLGCMM